MGQANLLLELRQILAQASRALAMLDAERLQELALRCEDFSPINVQVELHKVSASPEDVSKARFDMATFARILHMTRENLEVMNRLCGCRSDNAGYSPFKRPVQC